MAWTPLANLTGGDQPLSILDGMFTNAGNLGVVPCTATGTNTITLTPISNTPPSTYSDNRLYLFRAANTSTSLVQANVASLGNQNVIIRTDSTGNPAQAGVGDIVIGAVYVIAWSTALSGLVILQSSVCRNLIVSRYPTLESFGGKRDAVFVHTARSHPPRLAG